MIIRTLLLVGVATTLATGLLPVAQAQNFKALQMPSPLGEMVRHLDAGERGPDGSTPLQWAVYDNDLDRARELIRAGSDVNASNDYGANAMQLAAEVANVDMLKLLLNAGADVDSPNPEGQTTLMLVARTGNLEAARLLVKNGATIDAREGWGEQTALMWASARSHPQMMEYLIRQGAAIDARSAVRDYKRHVTAEGRAKRLDSGGLTPLLYAVRENCKACVEVLIEHGANLDKPDPDGVSPVLLAVINSNWDIAATLIEAGADVRQWDKFGQAPLHVVAGNRNDPGLRVNDELNETDGLTVARMLLEAGANPNMQLFYRPAKARGGPLSRGTTPLIIAADSGDLEMIRLLLEHGAEADLPQADRQTPVSALASARGPAERLEKALDLLVEAGADVNVMAVPHHLQRTRGGTPLHYAVRANNAAMVRALASHGADLDATDIDGLTALDYAMAHGHIPFLRMRQAPNTRMVETLRELGATKALEVEPFWPNVGPPFYYPWSVFPLDPATEADALVPGSFDHQ